MNKPCQAIIVEKDIDFSDNILNMLNLECANEELKGSSIEETNTLFGMLLVSTVLKSSNEQMYSSFNMYEFSRPIYHYTMLVKDNRFFNNV